MQFTAILVAALSASTLTSALHTDLNSTDPSAYYEEAERGIEKRDTFGWLSSFRNNDGACTRRSARLRPKIHMIECVKYTPISGRVGINWGTGMYGFAGLDIFGDDHCGTKIGHIDAPDNHNQYGAQSCVNPKHFTYDRKGVWRSVKTSATKTSPKAAGQPAANPGLPGGPAGPALGF